MKPESRSPDCVIFVCDETNSTPGPRVLTERQRERLLKAREELKRLGYKFPPRKPRPDPPPTA